MDVKWIKLMVDMFDNRKIRYLRRLPEGNSIVLIWVMLLSLAGRCNAGGMIHLTRDIPYTTKMLADELDFEENTVVLALKALEGLGMISQDPLSVTNWEEYQSTERMEQIREQTRKRVAEHRAKKKAIESGNAQNSVTCNVTCNADVTHCNAIEEDIEEELDRDTEREEEKDISLSISEREKERESKVSNTDTSRARDAGPVIAVFRSFLEREYKKICSPSEEDKAWARDCMEAIRGYVQRKANMGETEAQATCRMLSNENLFPREHWIGFFNSGGHGT